MSNRTYHFDRFAGTGGFVEPFQLTDEIKTIVRGLLTRLEINNTDGFLLEAEMACELYLNIRKVKDNSPEEWRFADEIDHTAHLATALSNHLKNWHYQSEDFVYQGYLLKKQHIPPDYLERLAVDLECLSSACNRITPSLKRPANRHSDIILGLGYDIADSFSRWLSSKYKLALPLVEWVTFTSPLLQDRDPIHQGESKLH
ncbi:MAG: hypothetical protein KZQ92_22080, partial [Candidatus Thiodiazotropha sp. (ex Lucinoma borealis)]|nr:hypothetical protein [Candidatus Thiodiazotropha sp. (ex Lucinoma borealis)]